MPVPLTEEPCPFCGEPVSTTAEKCRHCGEELFEEARPRREEAVQASEFLIPTNVNAWAMASCYIGLLGFCLPFVGIVLAIPAFIFGIIALRQSKRAATYGAVTSNVRAIIGMILSGLSIVGYGSFIVVMTIRAMVK